MLLKLNKPVRFSNSVKKIRLPRECPREGMRCTVSGWGTTKSPGGNRFWRWSPRRGGGRRLGRRGGLDEEAALSPGLGKRHRGFPGVTSALPDRGRTASGRVGVPAALATAGVTAPPPLCVLLGSQRNCPKTCTAPPSRPSGRPRVPGPTATPSPPTCSAPASPRGASIPARYARGRRPSAAARAAASGEELRVRAREVRVPPRPRSRGRATARGWVRRRFGAPPTSL